MADIEQLEYELYKATYSSTIEGNKEEIWNKIKKNTSILRKAIKVKRNKWNNGDIVTGLSISEAILMNYKDVDKEIYNELIHSIYTNTDIARIVLDGYSNGGYSFLLMSLWNYDLKLTEEMKKFAIEEAMNKVGTTKYRKQKEEYEKELEKQGITDDIVTIIDIGDSITPIGAKTGNMYFYDMFAGLSHTQAHGQGDFDIRYQILRNPNWTEEEKQKLVMDFWAEDEEYDEHLEQWEWAIVNDHANYKGHSLPQFLDKWDLYDYTYKDLLKFYGNKETTDRIWEEIQFCRNMHRLRPQQWEKELEKKKERSI